MMTIARVVDADGTVVAVLRTWTDASLVAEALGLTWERDLASPDSPEAAEITVSRWPALTDAGWREALTRLRGEAFAAAWGAARLGPPAGAESR